MAEPNTVELAKQRCKAIMDIIQTLPSSTNISVSCTQTLHKLALRELNFLSRCSSSSSAPLSLNIGHLEAIVHILQHPSVTGISRVCKPIPSSSSSQAVYVDIICTLNRNPVWVIVSDRKPRYISWYKGHRSKGLKSRLEEVIDAARSLHALEPCSIILFFSHGLDQFILERLRDEFKATEFHFNFSDFDFAFSEIDGDWINVLPRSYEEACVLEIKVNDRNCGVTSSNYNSKVCSSGVDEPEILNNNTEIDFGDSFCSVVMAMKPNPMNGIEDMESANFEKLLGGDSDLINFDTTALIALVSGISNGCAAKLLSIPENELRQKYKSNYDFVIGQAMSEIKKPILVELSSLLSGKRGIICQSAHSEFKELITMCGGPNEKSRANHLLKHIMVVLDMVSKRMTCLPTTRKLALKNKVVFGTGDYWNAPTLTANMSFVRAVSQTGMSLFTFEHRPRALTGD
ncbi:uncharacterized protein LOC101214095 isoform X1 [Cucumis sativus]|uniref:DUF1308 domain-containing protein n=1 Tax=Cucumis sativus TaxID=3659 RepID=A0A0A0L776_CUCSA|nr:uncharacterized protein LOC101214095 isoform X1 [Cucumis sativus]KGN55961.1 hypothetical protein Csa_010237 [Cucumis sativus]